MSGEPLKSISRVEWGWVSGSEQTPQRDTFPSADKAIEAMQERLGEKYTLEELANYGFRLARMRVTLEPLMIMDTLEEKQ